jgi:hypothetical protein
MACPSSFCRGAGGDEGRRAVSAGYASDHMQQYSVVACTPHAFHLQDEFELSGTDIGTITEATVRLVEKGLGAAWHFKEIEVWELALVPDT